MLRSNTHGRWMMLSILFVVMAFFTTEISAEDLPPMDEIRQVLRKYSPVVPEDVLLQGLQAEQLDEGLQEIDQHAKLFSPATYQPPSLMEHELVGIGAELFFREGRAFLVPYQGGAMALAGIKERVELTAVDGVSIQDVAHEAVAQSLKGAVGTFAELALVTLSQCKPFEVRIQREFFRPSYVELLRHENQPVLRMRHFKTGMTSSALHASIEHIGTESRPLFIDLRESTGGDLFEALDCAAFFLPEGARLGGIQLHDDEKETFFYSRQGKKFTSPVILLIGPDTASAAEAFASTLSYHDRAFLIGQSSYGKCTTQTDVHLTGGWVLRLTNGVVLSPDGKSCNGSGLQPDIFVEENELVDLKLLIKLGMKKHDHLQEIP
jgi:carboxyl-terminal processing protease